MPMNELAKTQRDAFFDVVYEMALANRDIVIVSADMGAPALDQFRRNLGQQYVNVGIAEQQAILVSAGLALGGKKVYCYTIAPFITERCYEQIKLDIAAMNIPVTIVGVGAGMSYDNSGPTHHMVGDLAALRTLPNLRIHNMTDAFMAAAFASISYGMRYPNYVRLDRERLPQIYNNDKYDFSKGVCRVKPVCIDAYLCIIATGNMVQRALEACEEFGNDAYSINVVDVYTLPIDGERLIREIGGARRIITIEEHSLPGGFGGAVCEVLADAGLNIPVRRLGLDLREGYCYKYGGRNRLQGLYGLDRDSVIDAIKGELNRQGKDES